jgi:hypothetical protein
MTRERSWQVRGVTLSILRSVTATGHVVSVHRIPASLLGSVPAFVEMHALNVSVDPPMQYIARVGEDEAEDVDYQCACLLAEQVGLDLRDG